jgi:hypothetical protein
MKRYLSLFTLGLAMALVAIPGLTQAGTSTEESEQIATVPTYDHAIEVSTECLAGTAIFKVTNLGEKLPTPFMFNLVRINSNIVVSKRRLRLASGQNVTFKVRDADKIPSHIGLLVNADDYRRDGQMHALVRCKA